MALWHGPLASPFRSHLNAYVGLNDLCHSITDMGPAYAGIGHDHRPTDTRQARLNYDLKNMKKAGMDITLGLNRDPNDEHLLALQREIRQSAVPPPNIIDEPLRRPTFVQRAGWAPPKVSV